MTAAPVYHILPVADNLITYYEIAAPAAPMLPIWFRFASLINYDIDTQLRPTLTWNGC